MYQFSFRIQTSPDTIVPKTVQFTSAATINVENIRSQLELKTETILQVYRAARNDWHTIEGEGDLAYLTNNAVLRFQGGSSEDKSEESPGAHWLIRKFSVRVSPKKKDEGSRMPKSPSSDGDRSQTSRSVSSDSQSIEAVPIILVVDAPDEEAKSPSSGTPQLTPSPSTDSKLTSSPSQDIALSSSPSQETTYLSPSSSRSDVISSDDDSTSGPTSPSSDHKTLTPEEMKEKEERRKKRREKKERRERREKRRQEKNETVILSSASEVEKKESKKGRKKSATMRDASRVKDVTDVKSDDELERRFRKTRSADSEIGQDPVNSKTLSSATSLTDVHVPNLPDTFPKGPKESVTLRSDGKKSNLRRFKTLSLRTSKVDPKPQSSPVAPASDVPEKRPTIFGISLEELMKNQEKEFPNLRYPALFNYFLESFEKANGFMTEDIFKISGSNLTEVSKLKANIDKGNLSEFSSEPHAVATVFKNWLTELPDSLVPSSEFDKCQACQNISEAEEILNNIPELNRESIYVLLRFLQKLTLPSSIEKTRMGVYNLSIIFGPILIRPSSKISSDEASQTFLKLLLSELKELVQVVIPEPPSPF